MDRGRASGVVFYSVIVAVAAGLAAAGYWAWRSDEMDVDALGDDLAQSLGASGRLTEAPSLLPFWLLIGAGGLAIMVAVAVGVALWVVPDAKHPPAEANG